MANAHAAPSPRSRNRRKLALFDMRAFAILGGTLFAVAPLVWLVMPFLFRLAGLFLGWYLRHKTEARRLTTVKAMEAAEKAWTQERGGRSSRANAARLSEDDDWERVVAHSLCKVENRDKGEKEWDGIVGFFHPFCNAGGGGERVLWAAIRATQMRWPNAKCVVYTGDDEATKEKMLERVKTRFNIDLHPPMIDFLYLSTRSLVLESTWPRFTLGGQSLGSMTLAWDAFSLLVPDIFVDTMGYAFALGLSKWLFRDVPTGAYVHYPTISTDMLASLDPMSAVGSQGVNAGKGVGLRGTAKRTYWQLFACMYSRMGASIDVVMTNSTWTHDHMQKIWGPLRAQRQQPNPITVVYPPVAVRELYQAVEVSPESEAEKRQKVLVYIAQFRPEKNHSLILQSFAEFVKSGSEASKGARLVLIGSVRDDGDSKRIYELRLLVNELHIKGRVEFHLDAKWPEMLEWLRHASVGVNGMWNEHFGIGVVEYQAAGLISVVHNSGGPKLDIVVEIDGEPTGFYATSAKEFAAGYEKALSLPNTLAVRQRARQSARRFTEEEFARKWVEQLEKLVAVATQNQKQP